ncbi:putative MCU family protein [Helianthus annuus]|nr:putative MCU family protein [Helianthus annuus]KAJ0712752.1 putative MCU family protein [Helianthus annuus]
MALRRTIANRLLKHQPPAISKPLTATKSSIHRQLLTSPPQNPSPTTDVGFFRRFLHRTKLNQSSTLNLPELFPFPTTERPLGMSVKDIRKILRFFQLENVRMVLRRIPRNSISYSEFVTICTGTCTDRQQGLELSKLLDEGGDVIVLGNIVFLRPDQVV